MNIILIWHFSFAVPLQPRNLIARPLSPNELEITWDPPEDVDKIVKYTLYYNDSLLHQNGEVIIKPPTTKYKLTDLVPDTIYHIQLSATSIRGEGVKTILVQARTPEFSKKSLVLILTIIMSIHTALL